MKSATNELKRRIRQETACLNTALALILCAAALLLGILFAIKGIDGELYCGLILPACALTPFFMVLCFALALIVFAVSAAACASSPMRARKKPAWIMLLLYLCAFALAYAWIPLTYKAGAFFASALLCAVDILALAALYPQARRASRISSAGIFLFAVWMVYLLYLSFSLFLIN